MILWPIPAVRSETVTSLGLAAGYTDNLFADSSVINDSYTRAEGTVRIFPTMATVVSLTGAYTAFGRTDELDYLDLGGSVSYLWGGPSRRLTSYYSAGAALRRYGSYYEEYNRYNTEAAAGLRVMLSPSVQARLGGHFSAAAYPDSENGNYRSLSGLLGLNATLPGSNSLDLEASCVQSWLADLPSAFATSADSSYWSGRMSDDLLSLQYRARWSRPVGDWLGLSLSLAGRAYLGESNPLVPGYTFDELSPWSDFWQGQSLGLDIKTFFIPHSIVGLGVGYRSAEFIDILENDTSAGTSNYYVAERDDDRVSAYLDFRRPFRLAGGALITPVLEVGYVDNSSTLSRYEFSSVSMSLRVTVTP